MYALPKTGQVEYLGYTSTHTLFLQCNTFEKCAYVKSTSLCCISRCIHYKGLPLSSPTFFDMFFCTRHEVKATMLLFAVWIGEASKFILVEDRGGRVGARRRALLRGGYIFLSEFLGYFMQAKVGLRLTTNMPLVSGRGN